MTTDLLHTALRYGELYATAVPQSPYLLIYNSLEQESLVASFFNELAPQLGWYASKIYRQGEQYEHYLRPELLALRQKLRSHIDEAQNWLLADKGQASGERLLQQLDESLKAFASPLLMLEDILEESVKTNIQNYMQAIRLSRFHPKDAVDEILRIA